ncbi:accessory gland protein Acp29AB-like [Drosophila rhopaloa]|uniref:C-type lectin domain-containing protein n=1 Tax=Drosophila rhopaloa TaxID=1041015 RepID=A0ABM5H6Z1_DRORH|nr:accessory gland protein Acp29AB-like [Drosophila rhopaloa]
MFLYSKTIFYTFVALDIYGSMAQGKDPVQSVCILENAPAQCATFCLASLGSLYDDLNMLTIGFNETQERLDRVERQQAILLESFNKLLLPDFEIKSKRTENREETQCNVKTIAAHRFELIGLRFFYIEQSRLNKQNWTNAENTCRQMGGHLASIKSEEEFTVINSKLDSEYAYWLGVNDLAKKGDYVSVASGKGPFLKWSAGEPDDTKEFPRCISVFESYMYLDSCDRNFRFICQADNEV